MKVRSDKLRKRFIKIPVHGYPIKRFIPNITTLLGLSVGLTALYHATNHQWESALWFVVIATVFDGMDGKLARFLNASSRFGAELDSLSDFVTFGVSPALIIYFYSLNTLGKLGWGLTLFFCICSGLRLARFNTMSDALDADPRVQYLQKKYFTGVPMPAAGLLLLIPLMIEIDTGYHISVFGYAGFMLIIGLFMISKIPTFALKHIKIHPHQIILLLGCIGLLMIGILTRPWLTFPVLGSMYILSFFISYRRYKKERQLLNE